MAKIKIQKMELNTRLISFKHVVKTIEKSIFTVLRTLIIS
jgi:hypothetical protein